ncbi:hypothetical protein EV426DRAFT_604547 [Tirmania nivea]|nr:hypothetical protein EV426DRAFT_604547 [Tirmania nivea]
MFVLCFFLFFFLALYDFSPLSGTHHYPWLTGNSFSMLNFWNHLHLYLLGPFRRLRLKSHFHLFIYLNSHSLQLSCTCFHPFLFRVLLLALHLGYVIQGFGCGFSSGNQGFRLTRGRLPLLSLICWRFHPSISRLFFYTSFVIFLALLRLGPLRSTKYQIVCLSCARFGILSFGIWGIGIMMYGIRLWDMGYWGFGSFRVGYSLYFRVF